MATKKNILLASISGERGELEYFALFNSETNNPATVGWTGMIEELTKLLLLSIGIEAKKVGSIVNGGEWYADEEDRFMKKS